MGWGAATAEQQSDLLRDAFDLIHTGRSTVTGPHRRTWLRFNTMRDARAFVDAALTLVPEGYDWGVGHDSLAADNLPAPMWAYCRNEYREPGYVDDLVVAATPALAICAAALRARAATA